MVHEIWQEVPSEAFRNASRGCGYVYECGDNYTYETESESEIDSEEEYRDLPLASDDESTDDDRIENVV